MKAGSILQLEKIISIEKNIVENLNKLIQLIQKRLNLNYILMKNKKK